MFQIMLAGMVAFDGSYFDNIGRALAFGLLLFFTYLTLWILAALWNFAWAWIDDAPRKRYNCFSGFIARLTGYEWRGGTWAWHSKRFGESDMIHIFPMIFVFALPMVLVTLFTFYSFFLTCAVCVGAAFGTRFVRRMKKAFDKHVGDKHAHQKDD